MRVFYEEQGWFTSLYNSFNNKADFVKKVKMVTTQCKQSKNKVSEKKLIFTVHLHV